MQLRRLKSRIESITYKAPQFGAVSGEVITGSLGRGEGGRFANIEDIKRASMSNNPLEVFGGSSKRMFETFRNAFTRESPFATDLDASQKRVDDLLAASGGNWTDEVKAAQAATDELWRLDTSYRRNMMTADTGIKPSGIKMTIEGLNSDKTGTGQSVAEMMTAAGKDPAGMAQGIGERVIQDVYNYMSMFNQRDELKKLNNASPEINLTTLPEGQKFRIDEAALAEGKLKIDFPYSADKPDGPSKDDITDAMSDVMMKLDPEIEQYAASFAKQNPNFAVGGDGGLNDLLQQAMATLTDDPQKMATENPELFKLALSASQGVNLFEGQGGSGQAVETPTPAPQPQPEPEPKPIDPTKYPGNDVEPGLEQKPGKRPPAKPSQVYPGNDVEDGLEQEPGKRPPAKPDQPQPKPQPQPQPQPQTEPYVPLTWDEARNTPTGVSQLPPDQQPPPGFSYAGPVQGPTGRDGQSAINPFATWRNPQTGETWRADPEAVRRWQQAERDRRANQTTTSPTTSPTSTTARVTSTPGPVQANTTTTNANTGATANNAPTVGVTPTKPAETPGPVNASTSTTTATPGPVQANTTTTSPTLRGTPVVNVAPLFDPLSDLPEKANRWVELIRKGQDKTDDEYAEINELDNWVIEQQQAIDSRMDKIVSSNDHRLSTEEFAKKYNISKNQAIVYLRKLGDPTQYNTPTTGTDTKREIAAQSNPKYGTLERSSVPKTDAELLEYRRASFADDRREPWEYTKAELDMIDQAERAISLRSSLLGSSIPEDLYYANEPINRGKVSKTDLSKIAKNLNISEDEVKILYGLYIYGNY